jgi:broad specificity phosphatase PhoE
MSSFYFIRHGEYDGNLDHQKLSGRSDARSLNPSGKIQVKSMSRFLRETPIKQIYTSSVPRAYQTAEIISHTLENTPIIIDDRLTEISYGIIEGMTFPQIQALFKKEKLDISKIDRYTVKPPGGESFKDLFKRVADFLDFLEELSIKNPEANYVIVTHLAIIHAMIILINKEKKRKIFTYNTSHPIDNASVSRVTYDPINSFHIEFMGQVFAKPPQFIVDWIEHHYQGYTNLYMYITFSNSYVVSFDYQNKSINAKFFIQEVSFLAEKNKKIIEYLRDNTDVPVKKHIEIKKTGVEHYPVVLLSDNLPTDKKNNAALNKDENLAEDSVKVL